MNKKNNMTISVALDAGQTLMAGGAETYRVEETMTYMLASQFDKRVSVFALPSAVYVSVTLQDGERITAFRRVTNREISLERISNVTDISRKFCAGKLSLEEAKADLKKTRKFSSYSRALTILAYMLVCFGYTLALGGSFLDAALTLPAGFFVGYLNTRKKSLVYIDFLNTAIYAFIFGICSKLFLALLPALNIDVMIIGSIMTLVPASHLRTLSEMF